MGEVVRGLRGHLHTVVVVDDGSRDDTGTRAVAAGAEVLRHPRPQGKGAALRTGWAAARARGFAWAATLDGDGQHAPHELPGFFTRADATGAPLVVGDRMGDARAMPWLRRAVNRWMSRRLSRLAGVPLPDSQCGFRLLRLDALAGLELRTEHFELESELLLAFVRAGLRVEFVPVRVIGRPGHSHIRPLADAWRWLRWQWGERRAGRGSEHTG